MTGVLRRAGMGILVLLLAACAATTRKDALTEALYSYQSLIRWGHFQEAASMLDPKYLEKSPISRLDWDRYQQIQVSGYNASDALPMGEDQVQVVVQLEYINIHRQTPRSITDRQIWRYDAEAKRWWLTTGLPDLSQGR